MALSILRSALFPLLLAAGLLLPGWLLGRALRTSAGFLGAFLGSAAILTLLIIAVDAAGLAPTLPHVAGALAIVSLGLAWVAKLRPSPKDSAAVVSAMPRSVFRWRRKYVWLIPAAVGFAAIAVRATLEPLSGFDTPFRWDFLAREILRTNSLAFYPPITADDFQHYGWCDGIAPLVSTLYLWSYLSLGDTAVWATAPVVVGQGALLFTGVYQLATLKGGQAAGWIAMAILSSSAVLLWGFAMGQETGMTALAFIGMVLFIERHRQDPTAQWLIWAGVAASVGVMAREYGWAFPVFGACLLISPACKLRQALQFVVTILLLAAPWYLRNWLITGNPLYSHEVAGLFPANPVYLDYMDGVRAVLRSTPADNSAMGAGALLVSLAGVPLLLGAIGGSIRWRENVRWWGLMIVLVLLWYWTAGQTAGGFVYSLRVLTPALALAAVLGGCWLSQFTRPRSRWLIVGALTCLAMDAAPRSWYFPVEPHVAWWQQPASAWRDFGRAAARWREGPNWAAIADAAGDKSVLVSDPLCHALLVGAGVKAVPFFSPAVRFLFESTPRFDNAITKLRADGLRFVLLTRGNPFNDRQMARHKFFRDLQATTPTATTPLYFVYDLYSPALTGAGSGSSSTPPHAP